MGETNLVVFKGTTDGIAVILDEKAKFEEILTHFKQKLEESKHFFEGSKVSMRFKGRSLTPDEQDQLIELLAHQNIVNLSFVHAFENEPPSLSDDMMWVKEQIDSLQGSLTHFHYGMVRSGAHVDYKGNVVVLGDVNPGGLVTAGGNIIILGTLKGKVHAGLDSKVTHPFVISSLIEPIQIGIGNVIAQSPQEETFDADSVKGFQIAYLQDEQIYVDQMDLKSINCMLG